MALQQGLKFARLIMVIGSMAPLFILWAIKGTELISNLATTIICCVLIFGPAFALYCRIKLARKDKDYNTFKVLDFEDSRPHLLLYLFTMLLPLYSSSMNSWRELAATIVALVFIAFLFWHLNMHYMNIYFAIRGYRIYTINSKTSSPVVLITKSNINELISQDTIKGLRISDTVFLEGE